eukprot:TRINITY_DN100795_c0_g1_i1.p1 TRINITY_DN100795_c0_g1~~TRINITY_DN100795_c0_g1_i1.p1  ORF type:complete len:939 (+),score=160.28 TRINITY_DN100795_c0_g1_i1:124-2940(+)
MSDPIYAGNTAFYHLVRQLCCEHERELMLVSGKGGHTVKRAHSDLQKRQSSNSNATTGSGTGGQLRTSGASLSPREDLSPRGRGRTEEFTHRVSNTSMQPPGDCASAATASTAPGHPSETETPVNSTNCSPRPSRPSMSRRPSRLLQLPCQNPDIYGEAEDVKTKSRETSHDRKGSSQRGDDGLGRQASNVGEEQDGSEMMQRSPSMTSTASKLAEHFKTQARTPSITINMSDANSDGEGGTGVRSARSSTGTQLAALAPSLSLRSLQPPTPPHGGVLSPKGFQVLMPYHSEGGTSSLSPMGKSVSMQHPLMRASSSNRGSSDELVARSEISLEAEDLELHERWQGILDSEDGQPTTDQEYQMQGSRKSSDSSWFKYQSAVQQIGEPGVTESSRCVRTIEYCFVSSPASKRRLAWDLIGVIVLVQEMVQIPLQVFDIDESPFLSGVRYLTSFFWSLDLLSNFFVGYHYHGQVITHPGKAALHYMKSWFVLDAILVSLDWIDRLMDMASNTGTKALRMTKVTRGIRAVKLLRLMKFSQMLTDMTSMISSEYHRTCITILKIVLFIVAVNHLLACGFYGLHHLHGGRGWINNSFDETDSTSYRYFTSLHWSLTQFTPASMEVTPCNTLERVYTVIVLLFAMVTFSSFVSSITTAMTHLRNINATRIEEDSKLFKFLGQHAISAGLTSRVLHFFQERKQQRGRQSRTKEADVSLLKVLPESMKHDLRCEAYGPILCYHPMFRAFGCLDAEAMRYLAVIGCTEKRLMVRDEIFGQRSEVTHMIFLMEGCLNYSYTNTDGDKEIVTLTSGAWACEIALWCDRPPSQPFVAEIGSEIMMLDAKDLKTMAMKYRGSAASLARYGEKFIEQMKKEIETIKWKCVLYNDPDILADIAFRCIDVLDTDGVDPILGLISYGRSTTMPRLSRTSVKSTFSRVAIIGPTLA